MDIVIEKLRIPVEIDGLKEYIKYSAQKLGYDEKNVKIVKILSKELDISDHDQFFYELSIVVNIPETTLNAAKYQPYTEAIQPEVKQKSIKERPIIVGFGPAGIFAALELIKQGLKPLIFERGKRIEERTIDVKRFIEERILDTESNIQFGEGGAGSFSDGKLFSRRKNNDYINKVLETYVKFGAPEEIEYSHKPHLGTDVLCEIVKNMRKYIIEKGGEIFYNSKVTDLLISEGKALGVIVNKEREYCSSIIYLALGHSARDTFELLHKKGISIEQRAIAVGVRIEHPVEVINLIRYGNKYKDLKSLGAANYSFTYTNKNIGKGVYTFCMCPGGEVVNASSENGFMVVNGMSYSKRSSNYSNSAIVVACRTEDYGSSHPLAGIEFQKDVERKAFNAAHGTWKAPAQNLLDYLSGKLSNKLKNSSCKMGTEPANIKEILPKSVSELLTAAFNKWKEDCPEFVSSDALLMGPETRTSCPLKIVRNDSYESVNMKNLYPIGEGAGYTGGITSSAADAIRAVEASLLAR